MPKAQSLIPRILVTNDDGIHAPGLTVLERIAATLSNDVWVVAPEVEQSGAGHSLSLHLPVRMRKISAKRFAVSGTPTDCVLLAIKEIIPSSLGGKSKGKGRLSMESTPHPTLPRKGGGPIVDLVLSGVNRSSNVGDDVTYSGTVAAAMEGCNLELPSIALSQNCNDFDKVQWQTAQRHAPKLIKKLVAEGWPKNTLININFPDCPPAKIKGVRVCPQGKRLVNVSHTERFDMKGRPYYWLGGMRDNKADRDGVDIEMLERNYITVTPLGMDLTDYKTMEKIEKIGF